jgi:hypothetical protein
LGRRIRSGSHASLNEGAVNLRQRVLEALLHIDDSELQERGSLHDLFGPRRVVDAGELHDDPVVANLLDQRLRDPKLVDTRSDDRQRALQCLGTVNGLSGAFVDLQRQVDAPAEIQSLLEGHALHDDVAHSSVFVAFADGDVARNERPYAHSDECQDDGQSAFDRREHWSQRV